MVAAIILCGGASVRMGHPKGLLLIEGKSFLEHIAGTLRAAGVRDIVIVLGADSGRISKTLGWFDGQVIVNEQWESGGQLSSLLAGLQTPLQPDGMLAWPVDRPLVEAETVMSLVNDFQSHSSQVVVPLYGNKRGHPVIFGRAIFPTLAALPDGAGARSLLHRHPGLVLEHPVDDAGVLVNIDTPRDYEKYIGGSVRVADAV